MGRDHVTSASVQRRFNVMCLLGTAGRSVFKFFDCLGAQGILDTTHFLLGYSIFDLPRSKV